MLTLTYNHTIILMFSCTPRQHQCQTGREHGSNFSDYNLKFLNPDQKENRANLILNSLTAETVKT